MARKSLVVKQQGYHRFSTRSYHRCSACGRPRSIFRKFMLCRICFRHLAHQGLIPGVKKTSW